MRIRKRFPPSSFSSPPLPDPQLNRSPVAQQSTQSNTQAYPDGNLPAEEVNSCSHPSDPANQPPPRPSDQQPMIGSERTRWVFSYSSTKAQDQVKQKELEGEVVEGEGWGEEEKSSNDTRKGSIFSAKVGIDELLPPSSSSHQGGVGRWSEGDKIVPLKKRRGTFERRGEEEEKTLVEKGKKKKRMKSKTNKKCNAQIDGDDEEEGNVIDDNDGEKKKKKKKKARRGNVIMEGSRCSRVNGRGWRCCQKTLVGYSLCEHHLGKGRLRSMTSVRGKDEQLSSTSSNLRKQLGQRILLDKEEEDDNDDDDDYDDDDEDEKKKPLMVMKKKMKLGVVKARSISSLLGQTNSGVLSADNNKNSGV